MGMLIEDLKARRIVRVAIAYFLVAVGLLCAVGILSVAVPLPPWAWRLAALATFTLLPFVLVLTWALEDHGPDNLRVARRVK